jgi:DNA polymerase-3 subunit gamma/tau
MSYKVLALKYRPTTFEEVVGQATVTRTLQNSLESGKVGHAFLLSGARGVGKTTTARILAKALNCSSTPAANPTPCLSCDSCREIADAKSLDVQEIDGATHNGVEQVRELRESARYNPARDRFKIWIIDEVHMLSTGAFNALLKTLEEPPPRVKFIFATTEYHKLPDTILSRCQQYDFRLIPARELTAHLRQVAEREGIRVSDEALARIARSAEGSARDALSLFDQVLAFSGEEVKDEDLQALLGLIDRELLLAASRATAEGDNLALLELTERLSDYGSDYRNFARELLLHFREILLVKLAPGDHALLGQLTAEERERLKPLAAAFSEEDLLRILDVLTESGRTLADKATQDPRVTLELALLKLVQLRRLLPFQELVDRVERLAEGTGGSQATSGGASERRSVIDPRNPIPSPTLSGASGSPPQVSLEPPTPVPSPRGGKGSSEDLATLAGAPASPPQISVEPPNPIPSPRRGKGSSEDLATLAGASASPPQISVEPPNPIPSPRRGKGSSEDLATLAGAPASPPRQLAERGASPGSAHAGEAEGILEAMAGAARPSLVQPLRGARARMDGDDTLVLDVAPDFETFASMHADEYRTLARQAAGRALKVRFASEPAAPAPQASPTAADVKRDRMMKEAARESAVQEALDLFNGKIVDVREAKPPEAS